MWFALFLVIFFAAPFVRERYRPAMSDGRRGSAPGQFVELSQGVTHFHLSGPTDGPLIVCVHGLTTPSFVWGGLTKGLIALGFRVLVYDLYGRGYSDRPIAQEDKGFFIRQINDLLVHLEINTPFHLMGYSMGGAIATAFAAAHPDQVTRLILLAPAGMALKTTPLLRFIRERGVLGDWLMYVLYPIHLRKGIKAERTLTSSVANISEQQQNQLTFQGFMPAILSSLRGVLSKPMEGEHLAVRRSGVPVLAVWGAVDDVIPTSALGQLAVWNRDAIHEVIDGAGHGLPYTHTDSLLSAIVAFLPQPEADQLGNDPH